MATTPRPAPQVVRRAAGRVRDSVLALQVGWRQHVAAGLASVTTPRQVDLRVDRASRAMAMRLEALTLLPATAGLDVRVAVGAYERLFPDGLRFPSVAHPQQWAQAAQARRGAAASPVTPGLELLDADAGVAPETPVPAVEDDAGST
jgi:hypothetical protein